MNTIANQNFNDNGAPLAEKLRILRLPTDYRWEELQSIQKRSHLNLSGVEGNRAPKSILTDETISEIKSGGIPDLTKVCMDLYKTFFIHHAPYGATQFISVLKSFNGFESDDEDRLISNPKNHHVLVQNAFLKVVLIHWRPGDKSKVHGHAKGGCVFKVLRGKVEEKRYSPEASQQLLAAASYHKGSMAYIDDEIALHAVSNPFAEPAISIHAYTPGR